MTATPPGRAARTRAALLTLYAHPFELAALIILGVSAVVTGIEPAALVEVLSEPLVYLWAGANGVGIIATIGGLFASADVTGYNPRRTAMGRAAEKAGLYLLAATMGTYAIVIEAALPLSASWSITAQLGALGLACLFRAGAVRKAERIELEQLSRLNASDYLDRLLKGADVEGRYGEEPADE